MTSNTRKPHSLQLAAEMAVGRFNGWFDPAGSIASVIEDLLRDELDTALVRPRDQRSQIAGVNKRPRVTLEPKIGNLSNVRFPQA